MVRGLYAAAAAMLTASAREDQVSANLANLRTPGYKQIVPVEGPLVGLNVGVDGSAPIGTLWAGDRLDRTTTDWSQGALRATANPLGAALAGPGFFVVQTAAGVRYTRDGAFHLTANGRLVTSAGDDVLGQGGPIRIAGTGATGARIADGGAVLEDGRPVARLQVVAAANLGAMVPVGGGLWRAGAGAGIAPIARPPVRGGMLEASNVDAVRQMVALLEVQRAYSGAEQMVQTANDTLGVAIDQVGKVA